MNSLPVSIDRIDFHQSGERWIVSKFTRCELGAYLPISRKSEIDFDVDVALTWCREHGWAVREWPGGARAWKREVEPVRSALQAERMKRDGLLLVPAEWAEQGYEINTRFDL